LTGKEGLMQGIGVFGDSPLFIYSREEQVTDIGNIKNPE